MKVVTCIFFDLLQYNSALNIIVSTHKSYVFSRISPENRRVLTIKAKN